MRKHFLILMLLTLLPFTAWAANINNESILVGNITYGSTDAPEVITTLTPTTHYTISAVYYTNAACTVVAKDADNNEYSTATDYGKLPVGTYYLKFIGAGAYAGTEKVCDFVVNPAPLTLTVTFPTAFKAYKTYDGVTGKIEANVPTGTGFNLSAAAGQLKNGDAITGDNSIFKGQTLKWAYTGVNATKTATGADFTTSVADYAVKFSGYTAANYTITFVDGAFAIRQKDITEASGAGVTDVTISLPTKTAVYNGLQQLPSYTVKYGSADMTVGTDYTVLYFSDAARTTAINPATAGTLTDVAKYYTKIEGKGNFSGTKVVTGTASGFANYIWEITKKSASVIVNSTLTKEYDGTLDKPTLEAGQAYFELSGTLTRDAITVDPDQFVVTAQGEDPAYTGVGVKNVTIPDAAISGTGKANYNFNVVSGTFTVEPAALTIAVDANQHKSVGEADPALTFTLTGAAVTYIPGSTTVTEEAYIESLITLEREAGEDPGQYAISVDYDDTDDIFDNYDVTVDDSKKFKINGAKIIITTLNKTKVYGDEDPVDFTTPQENVNFRVDGLADADKSKFDVTKLTMSREAGENVKEGGYVINAEYTGPAIANYEGFEIVTGALTITKAPLTLTPIIQTIAPAATYAQLATLDQTAVSPVGLKNGDGLENLEYTVSIDNTVITDANSNTPNSYPNAIIITVANPDKITVSENEETTPSIHNGNYTITNTAKAALVLSTTGSLATLTISDAQTDIQDIVDANDGKNLNVAIQFHRNQTLGTGSDKNRTWKKECWNSLVLPFDITPLDLCKAFNCYAIFNVVDAGATTENNVAFKLKMSGTINANTPFIVKTEADIANNQTITFNNVIIKKPSTTRPIVVEVGDYTFEGTYTKVVADKTKSYLRFLLGNSEKWAYIKNTSDATWNIVPFAAYVNLGEDQSFSAREVTFTMQEADGSTTTIRSIDADATGESKANAEGWYTVNGMKMNAPVEKGVYIHNGKKVVIK